MSNHESLLTNQYDGIQRIEKSSSLRHSSLSTQAHPAAAGAAAASSNDALDNIQPENLPAFTIPNGHNTPAVRMLNLPQIQSLIGKYPEDYFYNIEIHREVPNMGDITPPNLDKARCDELFNSYWTLVHPHHPILNYSNLSGYYEALFHDPAAEFSWSIKNAIVLVVLALGEVVSSSSSVIINNRDRSQLPGMRFFDPAFTIINKEGRFDFGFNALVAQAQILSGVYFAYLAYPLLSWRMVHAASTTVQLMLSRATDIESLIDDEIRLFWSAFLIESDRLAEFELPRSGIENLVDNMRLPLIPDAPDAVIIHFLAELSIRRLLNRVHNTLYSSTEPRNIKSLIEICEELNRQLETWYQSTPESARPSLGMNPPPNNATERSIILRVRYYACRHIIYRPFVLRMIDQNSSDDEFGIYKQQVLENCARCISSIRMYIHNVQYVLSRPSPYTWTLCMSTFGAILVVTAASMSPILKDYVPDIIELQDMALKNLSPWAEEGSSIKSIVWLIENLKHRRQYQQSQTATSNLAI